MRLEEAVKQEDTEGDAQQKVHTSPTWCRMNAAKETVITMRPGVCIGLIDGFT